MWYVANIFSAENTVCYSGGKSKGPALMKVPKRAEFRSFLGGCAKERFTKGQEGGYNKRPFLSRKTSAKEARERIMAGFNNS